MNLKKADLERLTNKLLDVINKELYDKENVAVLLTSGIDSRVIASLVKTCGVHNAICITVGVKEYYNASKIAKYLGFNHILLPELPNKGGRSRWMNYKPFFKSFDIIFNGYGFNELFRNNKKYKIKISVKKQKEMQQEWYRQYFPFFSPLLQDDVVEYIERLCNGNEINHFDVCKKMIYLLDKPLLYFETNSGLSMKYPSMFHRGLKHIKGKNLVGFRY